MRTLTGHEAIDVAEHLNLQLFDRYYKSEVSVQQAKLFIQQQREPSSFVLEDWPETDKEAEQIVLRQYHTALITEQRAEGTIADLWQVAAGRRFLHLRAAELAAVRLVEQAELELVDDDQDNPAYRIPHTTHFTDEFLNGLRVLVCDDCAHLTPGQPFHKTCLMALIDYLINGEFSLSDVTETRTTEDLGGRFVLRKPTIRTRWLADTVSATTSKLKTVVKPMLKREQLDQSSSARVSPVPAPISHEPTPMPVQSSAADIRSRTKISKADLIGYLSNVEIVDEDGELADLRRERDELIKRVEAKEREIQQIDRARVFLEGQCAELQRDMDTLLQALQIAKRRGHTPAQVIDGEISEPQAR